MTKQAHPGPLIIYGDRNPLGTGATGSVNPDKGPSLVWGGFGLIDPRAGYNTTKAGAIGFLGSSYIPLIDQVPSAIADNNIAASQSPGAAALTLVSSSGAGITVLAAATTAYPSLTSIPSGTLCIDTAPALVGFGRKSQGNSSFNIVSLYDPTKAVARALRITSGGNDSGITFNVAGYDVYGYAMTENITGANIGIATGKKAWKFITSITPSAAAAGTVKAGTSDVYGFPLLANTQGYVDVFWNGNTLLGGSTQDQQTFILPAQLSDYVNSAQWQVAVPFNFTVISAAFRTGKPASTGGKATTLTLQVNAVSVTSGGAMALTTANQNATGTALAASAFSGGTTGTAGQTVGVVASATTAFVEGDGWVEIVVQNNDLAGGTFTGADTTSPATHTTGDVRGTVALGSASDGTKRLQVYITPSVANIGTTAGLFGQTQV